jgi:hypothetical protein
MSLDVYKRNVCEEGTMESESDEPMDLADSSDNPTRG